MTTASAWTTLGSRSVHATRWLDVRQDVVVQPDGRQGTYDHIVLPGSVTILAVNNEGSVAVTRQWIYTHGGTQWRLPAGGIDPHDQNPMDAAKRELAEEVGATAGTWHSLGRIHGADSATNHIDHLYYATDLTQCETALEACEADLTVEWLPFKQVLQLVTSGVMPHAGSTAAVLAAALQPELAGAVVR